MANDMQSMPSVITPPRIKSDTDTSILNSNISAATVKYDTAVMNDMANTGE